MMEPKFLAPAYTHKRASHLIFSRITKVRELLFLKTLAFLSFQISQTVSKSRDAKTDCCRNQQIAVTESFFISWQTSGWANRESNR
jgi:hypothetical protein